METIFIPDLILKIFKINTEPVEKTEKAYEKHTKTINTTKNPIKKLAKASTLFNALFEVVIKKS